MTNRFASDRQLSTTTVHPMKILSFSMATRLGSPTRSRKTRCLHPVIMRTLSGTVWQQANEWADRPWQQTLACSVQQVDGRLTIGPTAYITMCTAATFSALGASWGCSLGLASCCFSLSSCTVHLGVNEHCLATRRISLRAFKGVTGGH